MRCSPTIGDGRANSSRLLSCGKLLDNEIKRFEGYLMTSSSLHIVAPKNDDQATA